MVNQTHNLIMITLCEREGGWERLIVPRLVVLRFTRIDAVSYRYTTVRIVCVEEHVRQRQYNVRI